MGKIHRGNWFFIEEENGRYFIRFDSGALFNPERYCEISKEHALKAMQSDDDASEVSWFALTGYWRPKKKECSKNNWFFLRKHPEYSMKIPKDRQLFDEEELKILLRKAKGDEYDL